MTTKAASSGVLFVVSCVKHKATKQKRHPTLLLYKTSTMYIYIYCYMLWLSKKYCSFPRAWGNNSPVLTAFLSAPRCWRAYSKSLRRRTMCLSSAAFKSQSMRRAVCRPPENWRPDETSINLWVLPWFCGMTLRFLKFFHKKNGFPQRKMPFQTADDSKDDSKRSQVDESSTNWQKNVPSLREKSLALYFLRGSSNFAASSEKHLQTLFLWFHFCRHC